jgi:hypothetical protein
VKVAETYLAGEIDNPVGQAPPGGRRGGGWGTCQPCSSLYCRTAPKLLLTQGLRVHHQRLVLRSNSPGRHSKKAVTVTATGSDGPYAGTAAAGVA